MFPALHEGKPVKTCHRTRGNEDIFFGKQTNKPENNPVFLQVYQSREPEIAF